MKVKTVLLVGVAAYLALWWYQSRPYNGTTMKVEWF